MEFNNMPDFGGENGADENRRENNGRAAGVRAFFGRLTPERIVDIICCALIGGWLVSVLFNWQSVMDGLFFGILFPIIAAGTRIMIWIAVIGAIVLFVSIKLHAPYGRGRW